MARATRNYFLELVDAGRSFYNDVRRIVAAVAIVASGKNPDGSNFITAVEPVDGDTTGAVEAAKATGQLSYRHPNPSNGETCNVNGVVFTYRNAPSTTTDVQIGVNANATITNLYNKLASSTNAALTVANYSNATPGVIDVEYKIAGAAGNSFTLPDPTDIDAFTAPSGATLSGGVDAVADPVEPLLPVSLRLSRAGGSVEGGTVDNPLALKIVDGAGHELTLISDENGGWVIPVKVIP
jgi:hypothetical protein